MYVFLVVLICGAQDEADKKYGEKIGWLHGRKGGTWLGR